MDSPLLAVGKERRDIVGLGFGERFKTSASIEIESFEVIERIGQRQDIALMIKGDAVLLLFILTKRAVSFRVALSYRYTARDVFPLAFTINNFPSCLSAMNQ